MSYILHEFYDTSPILRSIVLLLASKEAGGA